MAKTVCAKVYFFAHRKEGHEDGCNDSDLLKPHNFDFTSREATFQVDGQLLGSVPFNPRAGSQPDSVSFALQSDHAVDSVLRVNNVVVSTEAKGGDGK